MLRKISLLLALGWHALSALAQQPAPEAGVRVSLLTVAPGQELYSLFGHTALRVVDSLRRLDVVFNYGTFDFKTPNFYGKFAAGKLDYLLTVGQTNDLYYGAGEAGRQVVEQELKLTPVEARHLADSLWHNARPANRSYRYDFFADNCATRPRDAIDRVLAAHGALVVRRKADTGGQAPTYRSLVRHYLRRSPWLRFWIDLGLGSPADQPLDDHSLAFLPDSLQAIVARTTVVRAGNHQPLAGPAVVVQPAPAASGSAGWLPGPVAVAWAVLALALLATAMQARAPFRRRVRRFDRVLYATLGTMGLLIGWLWMGTDHTATTPNWHVAWTPAPLLIFAFRLPLPGRGLALRCLAALCLCSVSWVVLAWWSVPQALHPAVWPLALAVGLRLTAHLNGPTQW